jgi:hypothetical protein
MVRVQMLSGALLLMLSLLAACGGTGQPELNLDPLPPTGGGVIPIPFPPGTGPSPTPPPPGGDPLAGGVLATFADSGSTFKVWVTEPAMIQRLETAWNGTWLLDTVGAPVRSGPGAGNHNAPWSWHLDPQLVLFDGQPPVYFWLMESWTTPAVLEANLSYFMSMIKTAVFAPVTLTNLDDHR